jgi:hypothetical protein
MDDKFDAKALQSLTEDERRTLLRQLVDQEPAASARPDTSWKWDLLLVVIIFGCIVLAAWIGYLAVSLPAFYRAGSWRGAWVGFDLAELIAFAVTGWAAWRRRQILIICLVVLATLLLCDAWFDVVLDARTAGFVSSLLSALLIEVPIAVMAVFVARRLLKLTIAQVIKYEGGTGPVPSLWKLPLFGPEGEGTPLERLIRVAKAEVGKTDVAKAEATKAEATKAEVGKTDVAKAEAEPEAQPAGRTASRPNS